MNPLDLIEDERPEVAPLDPSTRAAIRLRVFGESAAEQSAPQLGVDAHTDRTRRAWLSVAAILLIAVGVTAVVLAPRDERDART